MINSYSKIYALGHPQLENLFDGPVLIEEKIDGSQISFSKNGDEIIYRSKNCQIYPENPGMFAIAIEQIEQRRELLHEGWIYRGEYLSKPKHNTLKYDRVPEGNVIIFDIDIEGQHYLDYFTKLKEAEKIYLECVICLYMGEAHFIESDMKEILDTESILGGTTIEGFVIKNYSQFGSDKKVLMGKYVSEKFKEKHQSAWKRANPSDKNFVENLIESYKTDTRWDKAIQHLKEQNLLLNDPKDIGILLKEIQEDLKSEEMDIIKDALFIHFWKDISRGVIRGFPEYYKNKLLEGQFK